MRAAWNGQLYFFFFCLPGLSRMAEALQSKHQGREKQRVEKNSVGLTLRVRGRTKEVQRSNEK